MLRAFAAILAVICLPCTGVLAQDMTSLYQVEAIVTGKGEKNREIGFRLCLRDVLVRVTGDQTILSAPSLPEAEQAAGRYIADFRYRDRLEGVPIHDEQGSYDRPHDLTCIYAPATLDPLIASLGRKPWIEKRPRIAVLLGVQNVKGTFILASDRTENPDMIESLRAAAKPLAIEVAVPPRALLDKTRLALDKLRDFSTEKASDLAQMNDADQALVGTLVWSDKDLGWVADWRISSNGKTSAWQVRGVSFDEAFRVAIRGAAQILSGNGAP